VGNNHPTVKPVELMKYLIKLITPPGGTVLDPFNGSGTTGMAAVELGFNYIGCELDPAYVEISEKRIEAWRNRDYHADVFDSLFTFGD
jgi:site-specific DNA-methyltransferase (adenine-specific)